MFFSFDYIVAGLAAIPYLLFTDVNYIDNPIGSGNFLNESAFCALLDPNIYPQVFSLFTQRGRSQFTFTMLGGWVVKIPENL